MQRFTILALVLATGAAGWTAGALGWTRSAGARQPSSFPGSVSVGRTQTSFTMPAGYTAMGKLGDPRRFSDVREHRFIPKIYGSLVRIIAHEDDAVLWFRDSAGVVRNVVLPDANQRQYEFEMQEAEVRHVGRSGAFGR